MRLLALASCDEIHRHRHDRPFPELAACGRWLVIRPVDLAQTGGDQGNYCRKPAHDAIGTPSEFPRHTCTVGDGGRTGRGLAMVLVWLCPGLAVRQAVVWLSIEADAAARHQLGFDVLANLE